MAWSTTKVEYRGMTHGICELLQLRILLTDWIQTKRSNDTLLWNQATQEIVNHHIQHDRTIHVEVDKHFIKKKLEAKLVDISFVSSEEQLIDVLTHVYAGAFHNSQDKLDSWDIYAPTWGEVLVWVKEIICKVS